MNRCVSVYVFVRNTTEMVQCDVASTCNQQPVKDSSTDGSCSKKFCEGKNGFAEHYCDTSIL